MTLPFNPEMLTSQDARELLQAVDEALIHKLTGCDITRLKAHMFNRLNNRLGEVADAHAARNKRAKLRKAWNIILQKNPRKLNVSQVRRALEALDLAFLALLLIREPAAQRKNIVKAFSTTSSILRPPLKLRP